MSAELAPCFVCGRPSTRAGGHARCALNAAKPQPSFAPVGQRVLVDAGQHWGRSGVVVGLNSVDPSFRYVLLDPKPRERTEKCPLVSIVRLKHEAPKPCEHRFVGIKNTAAPDGSSISGTEWECTACHAVVPGAQQA